MRNSKQAVHRLRPALLAMALAVAALPARAQEQPRPVTPDRPTMSDFGKSLSASQAGGLLAEMGQLAADFNLYGERVANAGMRFGYHNHAAEFADLGGGTTAFDILLQETDPALVDFELDLYWAVRGGQDPLALFARAPGRYKLFHVKDMTDRSGSQAMAPVGEGEIDFGSIIAARPQSGVEHFFVEHDNAAEYAGGSLASIATSYRNLRQLLP